MVIRSLSSLMALLMVGSAHALAAPSADDVLRATGIDAGLAVHLGATDGELEAGLAASGKMLIHGLALDDEAVHRGRKLDFRQSGPRLARFSGPSRRLHSPP